jgi:hypothetical protein
VHRRARVAGSALRLTATSHLTCLLDEASIVRAGNRLGADTSRKREEISVQQLEHLHPVPRQKRWLPERNWPATCHLDSCILHV